MRAHWIGEISEAKIPLAGLKLILRELNFTMVIVTFLEIYPDSVFYRNCSPRHKVIQPNTEVVGTIVLKGTYKRSMGALWSLCLSHCIIT